MKNKFADLDRQMAKALRAAEKGVRASQRDLLYQIRKSLDDIYRRYGKDGKLTMDEMRKYKRMRKLEAEIAKTVKDHRQEADKIIKSLLRYSTIKSIEACVDRNTLKPTRVKAIKARIDVDKIINETVGGRNWLERTRWIEGNIAYDIISEVRAGIDQGISYHEMAANIDKAMGKYAGRPETIARTETHRVIETSKNDAMVEVNKEIPQMKIWRNAGDEKVRSTHEAMEGQKVPFNEPFTLPSGAKTMYPGESGIASEDINCRCIVEYVDATPEEIKEMNADENAEKLDSSGEKGYNVYEEDIIVPKSLSAAAKKDIVKLPDGTYSQLSEGTKITKIVVFAGGKSKKEVKVANFLAKQYKNKPKDWRKVRGEGFVDFKNKPRICEIHWFESDQTGRIKMKVKRWMDEN